VYGLIVKVNIFLVAFFEYKYNAVENRSQEEWAKLDQLFLQDMVSF